MAMSVDESSNRSRPRSFSFQGRANEVKGSPLPYVFSCPGGAARQQAGCARRGRGGHPVARYWRPTGRTYERSCQRRKRRCSASVSSSGPNLRPRALGYFLPTTSLPKNGTGLSDLDSKFGVSFGYAQRKSDTSRRWSTSKCHSKSDSGAHCIFHESSPPERGIGAPGARIFMVCLCTETVAPLEP
jgi:hypothetical protein